jgi:hypothetical protein
MKILLFLGSGISYESCLMNVKEITDSIFNEQWHYNSNMTFSHGPHPSLQPQEFDITPRLQEFLKIIKSSTNQYFINRRNIECSYEDLYFICQQIYDNEMNEIDNPAIQPFVDSLREKVKHLCVPLSSSREVINLKSLSSYSLTLINCIVHSALYTDKEPEGLNLLVDLSKCFDLIDIATLNHDLLIEKILLKYNIPYIDGFGEKEGDVKWFKPENFDNPSFKIRLFKLHGSINWYRFRGERKINGKDLTVDDYALALKRDIEHCKNSKGKYLNLISFTPIFITGTYNKLSRYNFGIIRTIHNKFENIFWDHKIMIMSGYGWNDRGINGRLFEWILSSSERRLILLHRDPENEIKENSKSAMWHRYDGLVKDGKLIPVKKWFSEISINEILRIIKEST